MFPYGSMTPNNIPSNTFAKEPLEKEVQKSYDKSKVFQDTWVDQFLWAKSIIGDGGLETHMWCKVCSCIDKKDKLFTLKLDTL